MLKNMAQIEQQLALKRKEKKSLEEQIDSISEQLVALNQWNELLNKAANAGLKNYLFEEDVVRQGLTVRERLLLLASETKTYCEKHHNIEGKLELTQMKIENLEEKFNLLTMQEKNLYDRLVQN